MERILLGDSAFYALSPVYDEVSGNYSISYVSDDQILSVLDTALEVDINTLVCGSHDRAQTICDAIRANPDKFPTFKIYPCLPYAGRYTNAVTELGIFGALKDYVPGSFFGSLIKGGVAYLSKDYVSVIELMIDAEMKKFKGLYTPVIFLQNVITDLLLGLKMTGLFLFFKNYVQRKYNAEAGFISMNLPMLLVALEKAGIKEPLVCTAMNESGFRMQGGTRRYEETLKNHHARLVAMHAGPGSEFTGQSLEYICRQPGIQSIVISSSAKGTIKKTSDLIRSFQNKVLI